MYPVVINAIILFTGNALSQEACMFPWCLLLFLPRVRSKRRGWFQYMHSPRALGCQADLVKLREQARFFTLLTLRPSFGSHSSFLSLGVSRPPEVGVGWSENPSAEGFHLIRSEELDPNNIMH